MLHHVLDKPGVVIQHVAQRLETNPVPQEAVEAPAVDADHLIPGTPRVSHGSPARRIRVAARRAGVEALVPKLDPVLAPLDRVLKELGRD